MASTTTSTGNTSSRGVPQSAVIRRSGCFSFMRATLLQLWRWMEMPLPRVTKPTIGSGGAGLQHRASPVIRRSTPTMRMPLPEPAALLCAARPLRIVGDRHGIAGRASALDRDLQLRAC